jgi:lipopolysaccharide transport system permease protein
MTETVARTGIEVPAPRFDAALERSALAKIWASRWLLLQWTRRDYTVQYRQSLLGLAWAVLQPLLLLLVYGVVFKGVLKVKIPPGTNYLVFALCGLVPFTFISNVVNRSAFSLLNATSVIRQVYFPRAIVPLSSACVTLVDLGVSMMILIVVELATKHTLPVTMLAVLPIEFGLFLLMGGIAVFIGMFGALIRDIRFVIPLLIQVAFIATPIMYPRSVAGHRYAWVYSYNPIAIMIDAIRTAVISDQWPSATLIIGLIAGGAAFLALALWYAASVEERLPDLL